MPAPVRTDNRHSTIASVSNMSVAVQSPRTPIVGQVPTFPRPASASQRPKLKLNTAQLPTTFGNKSTSLRLETLSVTSPTSRNTFSNAYSPTPAQPRKRPQLSIDSISSTTVLTQSLGNTPVQTTPVQTQSSDTPYPTSAADSISSTSSLSSTSTTDSTSSIDRPVPYRVAFNIPSILVNGPMPRQRRHNIPSRPMFPTPKRVCFRAQLTEDIHTIKYTVAHSELELAPDSNADLASPNRPSRTVVEKQIDEDVDCIEVIETQQQKSSLSVLPTTSSSPPRTGEKRDSSSDEEEDDDENNTDVCPVTPVAGRRKRRREWVWTLGPVEKSKDDACDDGVEQSLLMRCP